MLFSAMIICFVGRHVKIFFTLYFKQLAGAKRELTPRGSGQFEFEFIDKQPMKAGQGLKSSLARKD